MTTDGTVEAQKEEKVEIKSVDLSKLPEKTKEKPTPTRSERKAMLITALERGIINDRMNVKLPPHLFGQWCRDDPFEVSRLMALGFEIDRTYAPQIALHSDGTSSAKVADVIHMVCPMEVKELIDEIRLEQFHAAHAKPGQSSSKEEKDYTNLVATQGVIPVVNESKHREARKADIEEVLKQVNYQTQPAS